MPYHVTTEIIASPNVAASLLNAAREVDFTAVVPEPANIDHSPCSHTWGGDAGHPEGTVCWYQWRTEHWGTKWNAYDSSVDAMPGDLARVRFDTAWSHPAPVLRALAERHPDEVILVRYADEDLGNNLGAYALNGEDKATLPDGFAPPDEGDDALAQWAGRLKYGSDFEIDNEEG